jgi:S1-C subfamily serine protease
VVAEAARSVVQIRGLAHQCQKVLEGSGVVIAPHRVMTSAHVVAGADSATVHVDDAEHAASVVLFNPEEDISILEVPDLQAPPLEFAYELAPTQTDALTLGYPGGGPFVASPARIREVVELNGPDIYRTTTVKREVYVIRGAVRQGASGGPLIDLDARVLGITFGAAVDDPDTAFALTAKQVAAYALDGNTQPVATEGCIT